MYRKIVYLVIPVLISLVVLGCSSGYKPGGLPPASLPAGPSSSFPGPTNGRIQSNAEGEVTLDIEWLGVDGDKLVFGVAMNTHSVDLDALDMKKLAVLRDSAGNEYQPVAWDAPKGGHHRSGILAFSADAMKQEGTKYLEMAVRDVAEIKSRVFQWKL
ncbi:MAG: hypothetical protein HYX91_01770 [Chloroflexi bacterium]|nr:hypothetical protein [Chloroflexota bacterium]